MIISNAPDNQTRQEIMESLYQSGRNNLNAKLNHLSELIDALNNQ
jgi:hypothetical protein